MAENFNGELWVGWKYFSFLLCVVLGGLVLYILYMKCEILTPSSGTAAQISLWCNSLCHRQRPERGRKRVGRPRVTHRCQSRLSAAFVASGWSASPCFSLTCCWIFYGTGDKGMRNNLGVVKSGPDYVVWMVSCSSYIARIVCIQKLIFLVFKTRANSLPVVILAEFR